MKVIILAGGYGSRLGSITESIPKPMVKIGGKPIIWHIMKTYSSFGIKDFIILLGYKGEVIKNYFYNYSMLNSDFTVNLKDNSIQIKKSNDKEDWTVTLIDTGLNTLKGGRIKRAEKYLTDDINLLTYGDGVANIDIEELITFHKGHGKMITLTGVRPPSRFGELKISENRVMAFEEKPQLSSSGYINGGFMVFNKELLNDLTPDKNCDFEFGVLEKLADKGEVMVYKHDKFWECIDTQRDLDHLNKLWDENKAFWKKW